MSHKINDGLTTAQRWALKYPEKRKALEKSYRARNLEMVKKKACERHLFVKSQMTSKEMEVFKTEKAVYDKEYRQVHKEHRRALARKWAFTEKGLKVRARAYEVFKKTHGLCGNPKTEKWKHLRNRQSRRAKERRIEDPAYRISGLIRTRIVAAIRGRGISKVKATRELIGCSFEQLRLHLEMQFKPGMNWGNWGLAKHGEKKWQIDHVRAVSSYDLTDPAQQRLCFHFSNLRKHAKSGPPLGQLPLLIA